MSSWLGLQPKHHLWWTLTWSPPPSCCTKHTLDWDCIQSCWFWVIPPLKHLIKPTVSCINCSWVQQFTCLLNHGFVILSFTILTLPWNNKHANFPNLRPMLVAYWVCQTYYTPNVVTWSFEDLIVRIGANEIGPYIVDISSLPPLKWLGIVDGTCVGKCSKSMHLLVQMGNNK